MRAMFDAFDRIHRKSPAWRAPTGPRFELLELARSARIAASDEQPPRAPRDGFHRRGVERGEPPFVEDLRRRAEFPAAAAVQQQAAIARSRPAHRDLRKSAQTPVTNG